MARNRQLTEKRILEAAQNLLADRGFESWGVNEVARWAGVDKVLIYRYFGSLDGLLTSVINSTDFWPDPDLLPQQSAVAFIEATLQSLRQTPQARALLAHPLARGGLSEIRRKSSGDLERWMEGLLHRVRGSITRDQLERLPALIHYQVSMGSDLSPGNIWNQVSPPLEWVRDQEWVQEEELPTELL